MLPTIIITRPIFNPDDFKGFNIKHIPLFTPIFHKIDIKKDENIIATSIVGIESLSKNTENRDLKIFCTGNATKSYAFSKGFKNVVCPKKASVDELIKIMPKDEKYFYARGRIISKEMPSNLNIRSEIAYDLIEKNDKYELDTTSAITCYSRNLALQAEKVFKNLDLCIALCLSKNISNSLTQKWKKIITDSSTSGLLEELKNIKQ